MFKNIHTFWNGDERWSGFKGTVVLGIAGGVKALLDNSWVFTSIPLPGENYSNVVGKLFYMLAQMLVCMFLWSGVGLAVDHLRNDYNNNRDVTERAHLLL